MIKSALREQLDAGVADVDRVARRQIHAARMRLRDRNRVALRERAEHADGVTVAAQVRGQDHRPFGRGHRAARAPRCGCALGCGAAISVGGSDAPAPRSRSAQHLARQRQIDGPARLARARRRARGRAPRRRIGPRAARSPTSCTRARCRPDRSSPGPSGSAPSATRCGRSA